MYWAPLQEPSRRLLCPGTPTALFTRGFWTNPLIELFPLLFSSAEAPLQGTASRSAGDPGLHPRWFCVLLYSSFPSPAPAHLPRYAHLLPRKTLPALLCWGLCKAEPYRRDSLRGEGWSFLLWDQHSKHRPTLSRKKWDQRGEFSLWRNQASKKCLVPVSVLDQEMVEPRVRVVEWWTLGMELLTPRQFSRLWKWRAKAGYNHHPLSLYCMWFCNWCVSLQKKKFKFSDWNHRITQDWDVQEEPFGCSK